MHPLDEAHLLTIGQDGDETGRVRGVALRIFDVGDASAPKLAHVYTFRDADYGYSEAAHDHHAFTFFPARGLLTIPFVAYGAQMLVAVAEESASAARAQPGSRHDVFALPLPCTSPTRGRWRRKVEAQDLRNTANAAPLSSSASRGHVPYLGRNAFGSIGAASRGKGALSSRPRILRMTEPRTA
jgi:hypothetical protein